MMKPLPITCTDEDIKWQIVEWNELLSQRKYSDALNMFLVSSEEMTWSPEILEKVINEYGVNDLDNETLQTMLDNWGVSKFEITSILNRSDKDEIIASNIKVDRDNLYGLDPEKYLGMVHYDEVPLCESRSDLTARFHIVKVDENHLALEFLDIHVM